MGNTEKIKLNKGVFISFEGADGCGKSTQIRLFRDFCEAQGYDTVFTREPGGTPISEKIRSIILDPENGEMADETEALLYAAARAQHVNEKILPNLEKGRLVLCDRFMDSSIAYQGYARGLGDGVRIINEFAVGSCFPDLTFFIDLPAEEALKRRAAAGALDRLEQEALDFHKKVYEAYLDMAGKYSERFVRIDGSGSISQVQARIRSIFRVYMAENAFSAELSGVQPDLNNGE